MAHEETDEERALKKSIEFFNKEDDNAYNSEYISLRQAFLDKFPIKSLETIDVEKYALGHEGYKDSFCYWLETRLEKFGNIHGSFANKFGVYFGRLGEDKENKWRWTKWTDGNFEVVREELVKLVIAGERLDLESITENKLSPMFKGKILVTYFPDKYPNIFSYEHVKYFLKKLGETEYPPLEVAKQRLLQIKNRNSTMKKWSNLKFSNFLYSTFSEVMLLDKKTIDEETPEIVGKELTLTQSSGLYVRTQASPDDEGSEKVEKKKYKPDYLKATEYKTRTGASGEKAVFDFERKHLIESGHQDLAEKVIHVSKEDDSKGYDVLSFDPETGAEKHIEVKSTKARSSKKVSFYITINEIKQLMTDDKHIIYYITDIYGEHPGIKQLDSEQLKKNFAQLSCPVLFQVNFSEQ